MKHVEDKLKNLFLFYNLRLEFYANVLNELN